MEINQLIPAIGAIALVLLAITAISAIRKSVRNSDSTFLKTLMAAGDMFVILQFVGALFFIGIFIAIALYAGKGK